VNHGEVECIDSPEIVGIEGVLAGDLGCGRTIQVLGENRNDGVQNRNTGDAERVATFFEKLANVGIDQGIQDDAWFFLDVTEGAIELTWSSNKGIDMGNGAKVRVLGGGGLCNGIERLSGSVRNEMKVIVPLWR